MKIYPNILLTYFIMACSTTGKQAEAPMKTYNNIYKTDNDWKKALTPEQYNVCRLKGTETPGSGKYDKFFENGYYQCVACGNRLFDSDAKFNSGSGWPSFSDVHNRENLVFQNDSSYHMIRTEVLCSKCGSHLGHVFKDGPKPTGVRYCINSLALIFVPDK